MHNGGLINQKMIMLLGIGKHHTLPTANSEGTVPSVVCINHAAGFSMARFTTSAGTADGGSWTFFNT